MSVLNDRIFFFHHIFPFHTPQDRLATHFIGNGATARDSSTEAMEKFNHGQLYDCAIDCCGVASAISCAIHSTKPGKRVVLVGMGGNMSNIPLIDASIREVDLVGVFRYRYTYATCIQMLAEKKIDVSKLITHKFPFSQEGVENAMEHCRTGKDGCVKAMLEL
ncbi:unnamed protein product [Amoebophrya sp. A120]|nr:unnamed protein product [Amoebophrya sp. A120]|eukprot:GSA120T00010023001.1